MENVILFAALGLGAGALVASIALAVVLVYRGSGVINVAMGAIAMTGAYLFWSFRTGYFGFTLSSAPAFVLTLVCMAGLGLLVELTIFRPLRNTAPLAKLAASLGLLLVLQAGAIVVFGDTSKSAPSILPTGTVKIFHRVVPEDRFWLAGIVIVVAAVLAALYRWTPFGLSTRAASENEVSAMLVGLSPSRLAVINTMLACVVAGGLGVLVAPLVTLDAQTLAFQVVPALAAALLAGFTSFFIACFAGLAIGAIQWLLVYWQTQSWFPTDVGGAPLRGVYELFVFLVIVLALFLRGASLPGRGEIVEKRLPIVPRPERLLRPAALASIVGRRLPDRLPVRLPAGLDQLAARDPDLPLAGRDHRLRRPDLGRPARARRRRRLHDVAPDDRRRRDLGAVPDLAADRCFDRHDHRAGDRRLRAASARASASSSSRSQRRSRSSSSASSTRAGAAGHAARRSPSRRSAG